MFKSLLHKAVYLSEKSRSIESDFSTVRKIEAYAHSIRVEKTIGTGEDCGKLKSICPFLSKPSP